MIDQLETYCEEQIDHYTKMEEEEFFNQGLINIYLGKIEAFKTVLNKLKELKK